jgi:hypothetical protein
VAEIRKPNLGLDVPGSWQESESAEPGTVAYRETEGNGIVTVTLLAVRSMYTIADPKRILDDYLHHRSSFERGHASTLEQSEPVSEESGEAVEGAWGGFDAATGSRHRHRVVLVRNLLADFRYEASGLDETEFDERAEAILGSATVSAD